MNKRRLSFPFTFVLPLFCLLAVGSTYFLSESKRCYFDVPLQTTQAGVARLFVDSGNGLETIPSSEVTLAAGESRIAHFRLPGGSLRQIQLQLPGEGATFFILGDALIRSRGGVLGGSDRTYARIPSTAFQPSQQIARVVDIGPQRHFYTTSSGPNPSCVVRDLTSIPLRPDLGYLTGRLLGLIGLLSILGVAAAKVERECNKFLRILGLRIRKWIRRYPTTAIFSAAAAGVIASCYPVIFFGKSFVSPNMGTILLYDRIPTVPLPNVSGAAGYEDPLNSDVGAMIWFDYSIPIVQSEALSRHGDLPLWDRYDWCGMPLLGQGQSMFGDPLNFLVMFAPRSSLAWDLKFLAAKLLFAFVIGLIVYRGTRSLATGLFFTCVASFIGFFTFRFNHPAFFSLCYSPAILLAWLRIAQASSLRASVAWFLALLGANWMEINSGTAKEAYMLLVSMNATGMMLLLASYTPWRLKAKKLLHAIIIGILFLLIAAPVWLTFYDTLAKSFTMSDNPAAYQTIGRYLVGLFDDIFYRELTSTEGFLLPSANFLVLLGCLLSLFYLVMRKLGRSAFVLLGSMALPLALVFSWIPASLIVRVPFLGKVQNIHLVFSTVAIVQLLVFAGFGFQQFRRRLQEGRGLLECGFVAVSLGFLLTMYFFAKTGGPIVFKSRFAIDYAMSIVIALILLPLFAWLRGRSHSVTPVFTQAAILCAGILLWRHGLHLETQNEPVDRLVLNPQIRANLTPNSPALESVRPHKGEAARILGFENNLFPGYNRAQRLEGTTGPDPLQPKFVRQMTVTAGLDYVWPWRFMVTQNNLFKSKAVCDLLNVKYYLALPGSLPPELNGLRRIRSLDFDVYESNTAWPRAFFTDQVIGYDSTEDFVKLIGARDGQPFAAIDKSDARARPELTNSAKPDGAKPLVVAATNYVLTANGTSFDLVAPARGIAVLSETYLPNDFRVYVNGLSTSYFRVNYAFKGIWFDHPGTYHVSFTYWPEHFTLALVGCGAGCVLLFLWVVATRRFAPREVVDDPARLS